MKSFVIGWIVGIICVAVAVFCIFRFGYIPVAANASPIPFEKYLAGKSLHAWTRQAAQVNPPIQPTEANLLGGAHVYRASCAVCHGLPGQPKTAIAKGMYPPPPQLLTGKGVTDDPVGETHLVVQNGIRTTGMPYFEGAFTDEQLWQVSLLLAHAQELPASVADLLRQPDPVTNPIPSAPPR